GLIRTKGAAGRAPAAPFVAGGRGLPSHEHEETPVSLKGYGRFLGECDLVAGADRAHRADLLVRDARDHPPRPGRAQGLCPNRGRRASQARARTPRRMTIDITTTQVTAIVAAAIIIIDLVIRVIAVIVVPRNRRPTAGMAWLLAIFFFPILGGLIFLLIGNPKLPKHRREKQAQVDEFIRESTHGVERVSDSTTWPRWFDGVVQLNRNLGAMPLIGSNSANLIGDYEGSLDAMTEAIRSAQRSRT